MPYLALLIIFGTALVVAFADHFIHNRPRPKGAHCKGWPTPDNQPTYYVMQRQYVRRRLGHKIRIYVPARSLS